MNQFYLNNTVGAPASVAVGALAVQKTMSAYSQLLSQSELNVSPRIVLEKDSSLIQFGDVFLGELVNNISDREEKRLAYAIMRGAYPVEDLFEMNDDDFPLVDAGYKFNEQDATNISIAQKHDGLLLSFAFTQELKQNQITITSTLDKAEVEELGVQQSLSIDNLYGDDANTEYISGVLKKREHVEHNLFDEIRNYGVMHSSIEGRFNKHTPDIQQAIVNAFKEAVARGLLTPNAGDGKHVIVPDNNLVRHESHTDKENIFEIVITKPLALRVFIAQHKGELYVLDIKSKKEMKDGGTKQNAALREAEKDLKLCRKENNLLHIGS